MNNPPQGMTYQEIKNMKDNDLIDMDYFSHEDDYEDNEDFEDSFQIY